MVINPRSNPETGFQVNLRGSITALLVLVDKDTKVRRVQRVAIVIF